MQSQPTPKPSPKDPQSLAGGSSLAKRLTLITVACMVIAVAGTEWFSYRRSVDALLDSSAEALQGSLRRQTDAVNAALISTQLDARFLSRAAEVEALFRARLSDGPQSPRAREAHERLGLNFQALIHAKDYTQARVISLDEHGPEIIRVDMARDGSTPVICPTTELQDKGSRDYVQRGRSLQRGEVYTSPINLNREHGKIQFPLNPTQRFVAPIFLDAEDLPVGLLVINTNAASVLTTIQARGRFASILTNSEGGILRHPRNEHEWGFEFHSHGGAEVDHPEAWSALLACDEGATYVEDSQNLYAVGKIPLGGLDGNFLGILAVADRDALLADTHALLRETLGVSLAMVFVVGLLLRLLLRRVMAPIELLTRQAERLTNGEEGIALASTRSDEVGQLSRAFDGLVSQLQSRTGEAEDLARRAHSLNSNLERQVERRTAELSVSEAQNKAILSSAADAILTIDCGGSVRTFNEAAEDVFGWSASRIWGFP